MKNRLWYTRSAVSWDEGMPLGNGRLGVMALSGAQVERLFLNEDTLWSGFPADYADPAVFDHLQAVRAAVFAKEYGEAERLINTKMVGVWTESYLPMAELEITMEGLPAPDKGSFRRELDLRSGLCESRFRSDGTNYSRTVFCSFSDQAIVIRLVADRPMHGVLSFRLESRLRNWVDVAKNELVLTGWCPSRVEPDYYPSEGPVEYEPFETTRAIRFQARLSVQADGQPATIVGRGIEVSGCREVVLTIVAATSFVSYGHAPDADYAARCAGYAVAIEGKTYGDLQTRHVEDCCRLFDRVELDFGHSSNEELPFDERLVRVALGESDPELFATAFQFGRYLLIASSREGSQTAHLQGIWNASLRPPWSSNYTVNINTQMNYWPAESCNLSECAEPLLRFVRELSETGEKTARLNYHCRGWVAHHNVDLWRKSTAVSSRARDVDVLPWSFWPLSGGWLCRHLWEHYEYGEDAEFLRGEAYPIMKGAALFFLDWLVEHDGWLSTCPSTSPENLFVDKGEVHGVTYSSTMDRAIIRELFENCVRASQILGCDGEFRDKIQEALSRLPPFTVGAHGQLMEWQEDFAERDPRHRHLSHLYGLYPSQLISPEGEPRLASACAVTLERKGPGGVPWSAAWKMNLWARLKNGPRAYEEALALLRPTSARGISYTEGGVYPNLLPGPPLQVDGMLGFTAGIAEMLVQSQGGRDEFLPALPDAWPDGYVRGLRLRGNRVAEFEWKRGRICRSSTCRRTS